jgi:hypothetical protein
MPAYYEIRQLPDGPIEEFGGTHGNYYHFSETDHLDLHTVLIWCDGCKNFNDGEDLSTVEEIDQRIRDLNDPSSVWHRITRSGELSEQLAELQRRRRWREGRKSLPKCICCGTTEIRELAVGQPIPNPCGAGMIRVDLVGHCITPWNDWCFTPEGDRIPRDPRPSHRHHPTLDRLQRRDGAPE